MFLSRVINYNWQICKRLPYCTELCFKNSNNSNRISYNNNTTLFTRNESSLFSRIIKSAHNMATMAGTSSDKPKLNRLSAERSPYLLQHATNPVDWYPWGNEAFEKAKKENKIIFLSVGYSTCHWCHVMEKESFESVEVAEILNKHFVSIKVDREERPDVDKMYMTFVQHTTGGGGWPMSVFLTPNLEPLYGGTYFPPEDKYGRVGFKSLLTLLARQWSKEHETLHSDAQQTLTSLKNYCNKKLQASTDNVPNADCWRKCFSQLNRSYEPKFGGFSPAPKFPQPSIINCLLYMYSRNKNTEEAQLALNMCLHTLTKMAYGGIHDHVNTGFARYSVDGKWHVPHFEKMLYDQAQLAVAYCDAFLITKDNFYSDIVNDILNYVSRDLSHPLGGFYGAEDADSYPYDGAPHKQEGAFCVWEHDELMNVLGEEKINDVLITDIISYHYNVLPKGNVNPMNDPHDELKNKNILGCFASYEDTAEKFGITLEQLKSLLNDCHKKLYDERQKRPKPHVDTKMVTSWNGLMISGFAKGGFALKEPSYIERSIAAANFIKKYLFNESDKTLLRCCYKSDDDGVVQTATPIVAFLDDYAFLIRGLLDLYEASLNTDWLQWAEILQETQDRLFWDNKNAGYFTGPEGDSSILIRDKEDQDGAEPCGNSVAVNNLVRLAAYLDRQDLRDKAGRTLTAFSERLQQIPIALPEMISALMLYHESPTQVFIAGEKEDKNTQALLDVVRTNYLPGRLLAIADGPEGQAGLLYRRHESLARLRPVHGKSAAYICRNFACSLPVTEPSDLADSLQNFLNSNKN